MPGQDVFIASDHAGFLLKDTLITFFKKQKQQLLDLGTHSTDSCDYPIFAHLLCERVIASSSKGILICGTGIGMSIAANRHPGIRAALCTHELHARTARAHNDANILCLGERVTAPTLACLIAEFFLNTNFEAGRHSARIAQLSPPLPSSS